MTHLSSLTALCLLPLVAACASGLAPGDDKGACDRNPEKCLSVRQAMSKSDGPAVPRPAREAIESGRVMQVWVPPTRQHGNGPLNVSGYFYVE